MSRDVHPTIDAERDAAAAQWLLRLRETPLPEEVVAEWLAWLEADRRNRLAFEAADQVWRIAGGLPRTGRSEAPRRSRAFWPVGAGLLAASLLLALLVGLQGRIAPAQRPAEAHASSALRLETGRGEVQTARLTDGSQIDVGGRSALTVRYSTATRLVIADRGEAFFKVAHDRSRPFLVQAGPLSVTAVGTAFSVDREADSVSVSVSEGVVEVRSLPLLKGGGVPPPAIVLRAAAGQRVRFHRGELVESAEPPNRQVVAAWRQGRLEFTDEPLRLAVARINRYSVRQIELSDPAIADLRVTGTVYGDRVDAWLSGIDTVLPVTVEYRGPHRAVISAALAKASRATGSGG